MNSIQSCPAGSKSCPGSAFLTHLMRISIYIGISAPFFPVSTALRAHLFAGPHRSSLFWPVTASSSKFEFNDTLFHMEQFLPGWIALWQFQDPLTVSVKQFRRDMDQLVHADGVDFSLKPSSLECFRRPSGCCTNRSSFHWRVFFRSTCGTPEGSVSCW